MLQASLIVVPDNLETTQIARLYDTVRVLNDHLDVLDQLREVSDLPLPQKRCKNADVCLVILHISEDLSDFIFSWFHAKVALPITRGDPLNNLRRLNRVLLVSIDRRQGPDRDACGTVDEAILAVILLQRSVLRRGLLKKAFMGAQQGLRGLSLRVVDLALSF